MGTRQWLAWHLVKLAYRLHDPDWEECIVFETPTGHSGRIEVLSSSYGCGVSGTTGIRWKADSGLPLTADVEGWKFTWKDDD